MLDLKYTFSQLKKYWVAAYLFFPLQVAAQAEKFFAFTFQNNEIVVNTDSAKNVKEEKIETNFINQKNCIESALLESTTQCTLTNGHTATLKRYQNNIFFYQEFDNVTKSPHYHII